MSAMMNYDEILNEIDPPSKDEETGKKGPNIKQVKAIRSFTKELNESSEDNLETFPIDSFVAKLMKLIANNKDDAFLRLLELEALVALFKVLPSSYDAVKFDEVAPFFDVFTTINDEASKPPTGLSKKKNRKKLADQKKQVPLFLEALEKISKKHPTACLKAGALETMLPFYNSVTDLKVAHSIVMNMSKEVPDTAAAAKFVTSVVPLLSKHLKDCNVKVVELASVCLIEIVKGFESTSAILDQILCNHELIEEILKLIYPRISGGGQVSLNTSAWMALVSVLKTCAKSSDLGSETFTEIVVTVKNLLTGAHVHPASSRPAPQIFEIVNLANELLPLPHDDSIRTKSSGRDKLQVEPKLLQHFGSNLLSTLIKICEDDVSSFVARECLTVIFKLLYFSSTNTIDSFLIWPRLSSFLAGVLTWKDPIVLFQAQQIANILIEKQPKISSEIFEREGVMQALRALIKPGSPSNDFPLLSSHVESSKNSCLALHLKDLCLQLTEVDNLSTKFEGSHNNEDNTLISKILNAISKGDGVSTFELIDSGVIDALLNYLSCGVYLKENITKSLMVIYRKKALTRWESFIAVALSSGFQDTKVTLMSILLEKLHGALSSLESFPLILTCDARSGLVNSNLSSGLSSLYDKINLRLCLAEGEKSLGDYSLYVVPFHPLKRISDVEQFLWPRVRGDEYEEMSNTHLASPKLMFFQGRNELTSNMTVYEVVQRFIVNEIEINKYSGKSRIWADAYNITYQSASRPMVTTKTIGSTSPSKFKEVMSHVDSSKKQMSIMDDILCGKLPFDLQTNSSTYKILSLLRLLEGLNKEISHKHGRAENSCSSVSSENFTNKTLTSKLEEQIRDTLALCSEILPSWCYQLTKSCPFLFPFETRCQYFYLTALGHPRALYYLQKQQGVPMKRDIYHGGIQIQRVSTSRDCILDGASKIFKVRSTLEALLTVNLDGEVDPGLRSTVEFYNLISHDLQKVGLGMWRFDSASHKSMMEVDEKSRKGNTSPTFDHVIQAPLGLFPCPWSIDAEAAKFEKVLERFELLGCVLAKALQDKRVFHLPLSLAFYKLLLGQDLNLHDIVSFDAELGQRLLEFQSIAEKGSSETENSSHDYMLPDYPFEDNVDVNNLEKYVNHVVDITVRQGIGRQLNALRVGFSKVFDISSLQIFSPVELERLLHGRKF